MCTGLQSRMLSEDDFGERNALSAIDSDQLPYRPGLPPRMSLQVPRELFRDNTAYSIGPGERVRLGSLVYDSVDGLFPGSLPGRNE